MNFTETKWTSAGQAPGLYTQRGFGADTKSFKIGERLPEQVPIGPGPGAYEVEKADVATKCRSVQINMSSGKQRPDNFTKV